MKYKKKPVVIEAFRLGHEPALLWYKATPVYDKKSMRCTHEIIETPEGPMTAEAGDYIIKGIKGELYPCKADIFEATYDKVEEE